MEVYITYDAHNARTDVKDTLIANGFMDHWLDSNKKIYSLPNTSLWHPNLASLSKAKETFFDIVELVNLHRHINDKVAIERFIVVPAEPWDGIEGEPHGG